MTFKSDYRPVQPHEEKARAQIKHLLANTTPLLWDTSNNLCHKLLLSQFIRNKQSLRFHDI